MSSGALRIHWGTCTYLHRVRHAVVCFVIELGEKIFTQLEKEKMKNIISKTVPSKKFRNTFPLILSQCWSGDF